MGALIAWKTKLQGTVALSSTEAEYVALCDAVKEIVYLRQFFTELGLGFLFTNGDEMCPTVIFEDNQSCIALSKNPVNHSRSKHIDIRYHYIWDIIIEGQVTVVYLSTEEMVADVPTKPLNTEKFVKMVKWFGLKPATTPPVTPAL